MSTHETEPQADSRPQNDDIDDGASDASSSDLPPPLIRASDYDSFVCASCVRKIPTLIRYAGTNGCLVVIRDDVSTPWRVIKSTEDETADVDVSVGSKRALSPSAEEPEAKRTRTEASNPKSPCLAPPINPVAQRILIASDPGLGTGDVFLTEDFRGRLCRCASVLVHQLYSDVAADSNRVASSAFLPSKPTSSFSKRRRHMSRLMILIQVVYIP